MGLQIETRGAFSVMEQSMRQGAGPPIPRIHPIDEWFYVMEGEMTVELGDQTIIGRAGDSLWIPRGTVQVVSAAATAGRRRRPTLLALADEVIE